jgi:imidazole glycerol-phosphate synthase subunit HisH
MNIVIVDYGSGNLHSAAKAFERAAAGSNGPKIEVSADPRAVAAADGIVLPGVGAFADCMAGVMRVPGMVEALTRAVCEQGRPFLGICVGMQLLAERGYEHGTHRGLGWIAGEVHRLEPQQPTPPAAPLKLPHMGWNDLALRAPSHPLLTGISDGDHAYFVHSFSLRPSTPSDIAVTAEYGGTLTAMVAHGNIAGTQFHPEKSQATGLRLISNFLGWRP